MLNLGQEKYVFAFFGGIRPNKGLEELIQAFIRIRNENTHLVIAGAIDRQESYAKSLLKTADNNPRIHFYFKRIPDKEVQVFINASDVVVLPFSKILTSGSAHLAMSFQRPVIAPNVGCLSELIESNMGWLYEQNDIDFYLSQ